MPHSPPNRTLAGAGVGRGLAKKPMRMSGSRGQQLVNMLMEIGGNRGQALAAKLRGTSAGRGQSVPLTTSGKGQNRGEDRQTPVLRLVFPHPSPCIWTTRVLQSLTLTPPPDRPGGWFVSTELPVYNVWLKIAAHEKEKEAA